ncbi:MAG: hypothetical protein KDD82_23895 [Planctomycetes bacterium]|nr:hypothetical protein [Planctomycetota bacterium]
MSLPAGALIRDRTRRERGYGRIHEPREDGFAVIAWPGEELREMRIHGGGDLIRAQLHPGQRVRRTEDERGVIGVIHAEVEHEVEVDRYTRQPILRLREYEVRFDDEVMTLGEDVLEPVPPEGNDPRETLLGCAWQTPRAFTARVDLLRTTSLWYENAFGIPAFLGARVVPLAHQIYAARRVLTDRMPRFVLADEVGLGKTIQAGLVLQALAATQPGLRALVIAPGAMSRQWLCELFLRFGEQVFVHVDALRIDAADDPELFEASRMIVSTAALETFPEVGQHLLAQPWDLLVIDEAHQIHPDSPLYGLLRELAQQTPGLLALSATPAKGDVRGLLGLLGLVAPEVYDPAKPERFEAALAARDAIATELDGLLAALDEGTPDDYAARAKALIALLPSDPHLEGFAKRIKAKDEAAFGELVAYVQEHHRVDRRIVRTRRATLQGLGTALCKREQEVLRYKATPAEVALVEHVEAVPAPSAANPLQDALCGLYRRRASTAPVPLLELLERRKLALKVKRKKASEFDPLAALGADPGPAEEEYILERVVKEAPALPGEAKWLERAVELTHAWLVASPDGCARVKATLAWLKREARGKVLVFAQDRETVVAFADVLKDRLGPDAVGAIHHELDEGQLSEIALRFQQADGPCRVLVSDELGGEGRNFQVASAVIHLDLPWAVGRLEQRVGRLDRIGRKANRSVRSVILSGPAASERALLQLHAGVVGVFERSLGGLEFLLPELQRQVTRAACAGAAALEALEGPLRKQVESDRAQADRAYQRALDATTEALDEAKEQAEILASVDGTDDADSLAGWAKRIGIKVKALGDDLWSLEWSWERLKRVPPGIAPLGYVPDEGRVRRRGTFSRERALKDEALEFFGPGHPLIDAIVRDLGDEAEGRAAVLTRAMGPDYRGHAYLLVVADTALADEALPVGMRYRAQAHLWPQVRTAAVRLRPGAEPAAVQVEDRKLLRLLEDGDSSDRPLDPDALAGFVSLPKLWSAVDAGIEQCLTRIQAERQPEVDDAVARLEAELAPDLAFLQGSLSRLEGAEKEEAQAEIEVRQRLVAAVRGERPRLAALAVIVGVAG